MEDWNSGRLGYTADSDVPHQEIQCSIYHKPNYPEFHHSNIPEADLLNREYGKN
jgi:hypothetical protein